MTLPSPREKETPGDEIARARACVLKALARRDYSRRALGRKLREKGFSPAVIRRVLGEAEREGYLDERRAAERFARTLLSLRGYAPARIRRELARQGIAPETSDAVVRGFGEDDERAALRRAVERKENALPPPRTPEARRKWIVYLKRLGFRPALIAQALDALRAGE